MQTSELKLASLMEQPNTTSSYLVDDYELDKIADRFTYHSPHGDQPARYGLIREFARALAHLILEKTPKSREQSLSITKLEEAVFWANAGIARNELPESSDSPEPGI